MCDLVEGCVLVFNHSVSCVQFFATPQTLARQAPLSMEFSRQKYWSGLPFPTPYRWVGEEKILGWFRFRRKHPKWRKRCFEKKKKKKILGYRNGRVTVPLTPWSSAPCPNMTIVCTLMPSSGMKKDILSLNLMTEEAQTPGRQRKGPSSIPHFGSEICLTRFFFFFPLLPVNFFLLNNPKTFRNMCEGEHYPIWRTICTQVWGCGERKP